MNSSVVRSVLICHDVACAAVVYCNHEEGRRTGNVGSAGDGRCRVFGCDVSADGVERAAALPKGRMDGPMGR